MNKFTFTNNWFENGLKVWESTVKPVLQERSQLQVLEIGCYEGQATAWFLDTFTRVKVTVVDTFQGNLEHALRGWDMSDLERTFRQNMHATGKAKAVKILKGKSQEILPNIQDSFDLIYVDGDHRAPSVWKDLQQAHRLLKPDGILVCDDYEWNPIEFQNRPDMTPRPAIDKFMLEHAEEYTPLFIGWQVVLSRKL